MNGTNPPSAKPPPRILAIAGSDSSGGAGIQADIKTIAMLGGYAMTAITALTAQNTKGVQGIAPIDGAFVRDQIASCLDDIGADTIKIGMLGNEDIVRHVAEALSNRDPLPLILDPVMVATSGDTLVDRPSIAAMRETLFPLATLLTPNLPELELLAGSDLRRTDIFREAAVELAREFDCHVLAKGGHTDDQRITDLLVDSDGRAIAFEHERIDTPHTHGTGCTLASAVATLVGHGLPMDYAVRIARKFVFRAIEAAPGFGGGHGPLGHHAVRNVSDQEGRS